MLTKHYWTIVFLSIVEIHMNTNPGQWTFLLHALVPPCQPLCDLLGQDFPHFAVFFSIHFVGVVVDDSFLQYFLQLVMLHVEALLLQSTLQFVLLVLRGKDAVHVSQELLAVLFVSFLNTFHFFLQTLHNLFSFLVPFLFFCSHCLFLIAF